MYISISSRARAILLIGLAALTLFVVGPLAGSVDDDGDGSPDIPVVVSVLIPDFSADAGVDQLDDIQHETTSGDQRSSTPSTAIIDSESLSVDSGSILHSSCSLRC